MGAREVGGNERDRSIFGRGRSPGWWALVLLIGTLTVGATVAVAVMSTPSPASPALTAPVRAESGSGTLVHGCDGMFWAENIWARYSPSYCYGHDEPTISYVSTAAGSGEDASFQAVLPADGTYPQGDFYATIWFGGTVYDVDSTAGSDQAFLEFQFYPAPPAVTGSGSGSQDCAPNGGFNANFQAGSNEWFACAIVWQLTGSSLSPTEDAAFAGPLDVAGSNDAIMVMHSNDRIFVNYSGVAQQTAWTLTVTDHTTGQTGSVTLQNGSLVLSPYYSTAAAGNTMSWGASAPGAIAFAYEIGHALNPSIPEPSGQCSPGDGVCDSYWPGRWAQSGQMDLSLPLMGTGSSATFPAQLGFSSSQGGEAEINASSCGAPSTSTSTNCLYPWYMYRGGSYGFTFGTSDVTNTTYDYGNLYQFPSVSSTHHTVTAPWGTVSVTVSPTTATVDFNPKGIVNPLTVSSSGTAGGQFLSGPYWLNVSASGCTSSSQFVYVKPGATDDLPVTLSCGSTPLSASASATPTSGVAPLSVSFTGSASGGTSPYTYSWAFGDGSTSTAQDPTHTYSSAGTYTATLTVKDSAGHTATSSVTITVSAPPSGTPSCAGETITVSFGSEKNCSLNQGQSVVFEFTVTQTQWNNYYYVNVYEADGTVTGTQPVFQLGTGMGGTPSLSGAKQTANGPNAAIQIDLFTQASGTYGGWGTYWALIDASGGSGGVCFLAELSNNALGSGPSCTATGSGGSSLSASASATPTSGVAPLSVSFTGSASGGTSPYTYSWAFGDGSTSTAQDPTHTYSSAGTYTATLTVKDSAGHTATSSVTITVSAPPSGTPSCAGETITVSFGSEKNCSLNQGQSVVFEFTVTQTQWNNYYYVNVYEADGTVTGTQPVFQLGTGMGGTPSLSGAKQTANGPNAAIQIDLFTQASGTYGGWGTYWAIVTAPGGSGGFCFEAQLSNNNLGSGPSCSAALQPSLHPGTGSGGSTLSFAWAGSGEVPGPTLYGVPVVPPLAAIIVLGIVVGRRRRSSRASSA
jgi:PKD repeat protein